MALFNVGWFETRKKELRDANEALKLARAGVPTRARAFHKAVDQVLLEIGYDLAKVLPDSSKTRKRCAEADELVTIAPEIQRILAEVMDLESRIDTLSKDLDGADTELAAAGATQCEIWLGVLKPAAVRIDSPAELATAASFSGLRVSIEQYCDGVKHLLDAEELARRKGKGPTTALLEIAAGAFRQRMIEQGPNQHLLHELKRQFELVNVPAPPPPEPPDGLQDLRTQIPACGQWSRVLRDVDASLLRKLQDELFLLENQPDLWNTPALDNLRGRSRDFLESLKEKALSIRTDRTLRLTQWVSYYVAACAVDDGLRVRIESLRALPVGDPPEFERWKSEEMDFSHFYHGLAQTKLNELGDYCGALLKFVNEKLRQLSEARIRDEVRRKLEEYERKIQQLHRREGRDAILHALDEATQIRDSLQQIERQVPLDSAEYAKEETLAQTRYDHLRYAADKVGFQLDLQRPGAAAGPSFDVNIKALRESMKKIDVLETNLMKQCHDSIKESARYCAEVLPVLRKVPDMEPASLNFDSVADGPRQVADKCAEALEARRQLGEALHEAVERLEVQVKEQWTRLDRVARSGARNAVDARSFMNLIDEMGMFQDPDELERARGLVNLTEQCGDFFSLIEHGRVDARKRLTRLNRAWRDFTLNGLRHYFPRHSDRIAALIQGIPNDLEDWQAFLPQLDEAERLLDTLESYARRVAADEVDRTLRTLPDRIRLARPEERKALEFVIEEVRGHGNRLPPSNLRRRLLDGASRLPHA